MAIVTLDGWLLSAKRHSTSLSPDRQTVLSFDLEGRPLSWFEAGRVFKRTLGSEVHGRARHAGSRERWRLSADEAEVAFAGLLERVRHVPRARLDAELRQRLDDILRWTPQRLLEEQRRFRAVYRPISILPPDQYLSVVLQATFGCSWNRCTFCSFYQDRPFTTRPVAEFREHVKGVAELLGRGSALRQEIFLADGNALVLSNERLRPILETAGEAFPRRPIQGFVDVLTGERKPVEGWTELRRLGLERVCIGVETGHDPLLRWMNKPGHSADVAQFVPTLKSAGLALSLVVLCGAGGRRFAARHENDTLRLIGKLPLDAGDIIYLSPFVEHADSEYAKRASAQGVRALDERELAAQYARLRDGLRRARPGLKVARYDIREFLY